MSLRFYVDNLVKQSEIYPSESDAQFPAVNLKDDRRTKIYRSTTGSCNLVFDFGDIRQIDTVALVDSNISTFGFDSVIIELNNVNSWTSPPVSQSITVDSYNGYANFNWPSDQNYRYARLVFTNGVFPVEVSKIFIGKSVYLQDICFTYPLSYRQNNRAITSQNRYGQKFFDEINSQKEVKGEIPSLNKDEMDLILETLDMASFTRPIWLNFNSINILNDQNRISGYYYLSDDPEMQVQAGNYWSLGLSFQEGM
jgi:hypothetical protein